MTRFALTPAARADLVEIYEVIEPDDPKAAKRVLAKLRVAMRRLARTPGLGHLRDDLADEALRFWPVYSYLIIYRPETRPLQIVRVVHGARSIRRLLEAE